MRVRKDYSVSEDGLVLGASLGPGNIRARLAVFEALDPIGAGEAFADIGCGRGGYSVQLAARCKRISVVDVQAQNIEATKQALAAVPSTAAEFHCAPAERLPLADDSYEAVFLVEVLDHVRDVAGCLAEAQRILKPRGRCYLSVPNRRFPFENHPVKLLGSLLTPRLFPLLPWFPPLHRRMATARVFTPAEVRRLSGQAGFRSIKLDFVMPPFEGSGLTVLRELAIRCARTPLRNFGVSIAAVLTK